MYSPVGDQFELSVWMKCQEVINNITRLRWCLVLLVYFDHISLLNMEQKNQKNACVYRATVQTRFNKEVSQ